MGVNVTEIIRVIRRRPENRPAEETTTVGEVQMTSPGVSDWSSLSIRRAFNDATRNWRRRPMGVSHNR